MGEFQSIVITVAIILLILCMAAIGAIMYYDEKDVDFPPVIANCPDFWQEKRGESGSEVCVPYRDIGLPGSDNPSCYPDSIDFNVPEYTGKAGTCKKKLWAQGCGFSWDGITNTSSARDPCKGVD